MKKKIVTIIGARPQFIKASALSREFLKSNDFKEFLVHTGQHYDPNMSEKFFQEFSMNQPTINLCCASKSNTNMIGNIIKKTGKILDDLSPNLVLVYGDTDSTLGGSIAAAKRSIPLAHIESGLRSYNHKMPEEINRRITDHLSSFLFCPTRQSKLNLKKEGITKNVFHVGDVMLDVSKNMRKKIIKNNKYKKFHLKKNGYALLTIHRFENVSDTKRLKDLINYVRYTYKKHIVFLAHPRTRKVLKKKDLHLKNFLLLEPLGYTETSNLLLNSEIVFTDSGGIQKEAFFLKKRCVTLRDETEWTETIENGWNKLWKSKGFKTKKNILDYGNGNAALKIIKILKNI